MNKIAFQYDAYRPLVVRIPGGGVPGSGGWGMYLVLGGVPGLVPGGVYLADTPLDQAHPPGTRPGTPPPGPDQVHPPGTRPGTPPPGPDQVHPPGPDQLPPPVNRITDRCKNITLAQLRCGP